jgi:hypothetical protein
LDYVCSYGLFVSSESEALKFIWNKANLTAEEATQVKVMPIISDKAKNAADTIKER